MAAAQEKSFTGKVALVTGGSKGIGAGIVRRLASDGASVACSAPLVFRSRPSSHSTREGAR